jgi:hypothetical protein
MALQIHYQKLSMKSKIQLFFMLKAKSNKSDPYYSTITNFYGCNLHYFMAKNKSKDELLIKLIFGESNKITLGQNQNQIKSTLFLSFYSSTITNFYGKNMHNFMGN